MKLERKKDTIVLGNKLGTSVSKSIMISSLSTSKATEIFDPDTQAQETPTFSEFCTRRFTNTSLTKIH